VFLVQREVAERMTAAPGSKEYGALSVNLQALARVELLFAIAPGAFHPPPKVESAVVRITPRANPIVPPELEARFRTFVQDAFALRRKQMRRVIRTITGLDAQSAEHLLHAAGVDPNHRPEDVGVEEYAGIVRKLECE
jgi:16S rRNA (adenine1518-N6/adenine1519-N6)-dimethyltransferase